MRCFVFILFSFLFFSFRFVSTSFNLSKFSFVLSTGIYSRNTASGYASSGTHHYSRLMCKKPSNALKTSHVIITSTHSTPPLLSYLIYPSPCPTSEQGDPQPLHALCLSGRNHNRHSGHCLRSLSKRFRPCVSPPLLPSSPAHSHTHPICFTRAPLSSTQYTI